MCIYIYIYMCIYIYIYIYIYISTPILNHMVHCCPVQSLSYHVFHVIQILSYPRTCSYYSISSEVVCVEGCYIYVFFSLQQLLNDEEANREAANQSKASRQNSLLEVGHFKNLGQSLTLIHLECIVILQLLTHLLT